MAYKQVILVRTDLKMSRGKACAQCSHAAVEASLKAKKKPFMFNAWRLSGMKKVTLKVANQKDLYKYAQHAKDVGLVTAIISDAGMTELKPGTTTCCAIGPDKDDKIDQVTGKLQTL
jgi:peptidyl-tRNA hydrolase, PTH2 family